MLVMLVGVGTLSLGTAATTQPLSPDLSVLQQTSDNDCQNEEAENTNPKKL